MAISGIEYKTILPTLVHGKPSFFVQVANVLSLIDNNLAASYGLSVIFSMFHSPRVWIYWLFWIFSITRADIQFLDSGFFGFFGFFLVTSLD